MTFARVLGVFSFAILAACAAPSGEPVGEDSAELRQKPRYTTDTRAVVGEYANDESCTGGFDACERIRVRRAGDRLEVVIGSYENWGSDGLVAEAHATASGALVFTTGDLADELPWGDCQDPGCGDLRKVSGVIYPVAQGNRWVPRVKATYTLEFLHPDEEDAPEGELRETRYLTKE